MLLIAFSHVHRTLLKPGSWFPPCWPYELSESIPFSPVCFIFFIFVPIRITVCMHLLDIIFALDLVCVYFWLSSFLLFLPINNSFRSYIADLEKKKKFIVTEYNFYVFLCMYFMKILLLDVITDFKFLTCQTGIALYL